MKNLVIRYLTGDELWFNAEEGWYFGEEGEDRVMQDTVGPYATFAEALADFPQEGDTIRASIRRYIKDQFTDPVVVQDEFEWLMEHVNTCIEGEMDNAGFVLDEESLIWNKATVN